MTEAGCDRESITEETATFLKRGSQADFWLTAMGIITHSWRIIGRFQSKKTENKKKNNR